MKDNIITVPLTSGMETKINLVGGSHAIITNRSDSVVYVSKYPSIVADSNGVKAIEGGSADILRDVAAHSIKDNTSDWYGTIYALSDSDSKIQIETTNNSNFKQVVRGGDENSTVIKSSNIVACITTDNITTEYATDIKKYPDVVLEVTDTMEVFEGYTRDEKRRYILKTTIKTEGDYKCIKYGIVYTKNFPQAMSFDEIEKLLTIENIDETNIKGAYSSAIQNNNPSTFYATITNNGLYKATYFRCYYIIDVDGTEEYFWGDVFYFYCDTSSTISNDEN